MSNSDFINKYVAEHKKQLEELRVKANLLAFDGQWVIIGDDDYPQKREQYATTSFVEEYVSPRIILYPTGEKDIQKAIGLCHELKMAISVRTGGHQYCGYSSTSPVNMQIDLSETFPEYEYDAETNVLRCGVSHALGSWAKMNHDHGIYLPMGVCAYVNLGGHVHTGGWGMVARSHGLLADRVLAFDIILANGEQERIVRPEAGKTTQHNDDVYYAVLGGSKGGDFGIVTHWEFSPLRDKDYPNSACYTFAWLWSRRRMEAVARKMAQLSKLCAEGKIPSDYEFMLNITGSNINLHSDAVRNGLKDLGLGSDNLRFQSSSSPSAVRRDLTDLGLMSGGDMRELPRPVQTELEAGLNMHLFRDMNDAPDYDKKELLEMGILDGGPVVPPLIQMWMCFTNKGGKDEQFDDQWFESFTQKDVCGEPLPNLAIRLKNTPVSKGLAEHFIMNSEREMEYPFVKRFRATMDVPENFSETYTRRMYMIMGSIGTREGQHLVSQMQIYAGGAVEKNGEAKLTSYSWRKQALAMSHDSFYRVGRFHRKADLAAEQWQLDNDEEFIEQKEFADVDMRMFVYTFGDRVLENVWQYYYDSQEKYERLRRIKGTLDPDGLFSADDFSLKPL
jgi:FAD/FMN-containing dehydrogenase